MAKYDHIEIMREETVKPYRFQQFKNAPHPPVRNSAEHGRKLKEEIREYEYLKEPFKDYKYKEEILDKELKKIEQQIVSSKITEHQAIIKKAIVEDIKKENEYGIYYYMNLYLHMIFNKISENSLGIIILTILIITMMYIF